MAKFAFTKGASFLALLGIGFLFPALVLGKIGVGINVGKINVDQELKPGIIYTLPSITVINNGDEPSDYGVFIEYHVDQELKEDMGLRPEREWLSFKPVTFRLEPGQVQAVTISLNLPIKAKPGRYFAYLEARPVTVGPEGITSIGIAVAAKLRFNVVAANIFAGIYWRLVSLYALYNFWVNLVAGIVGASILTVLFKKFFKFNIALKGSEKPEPRQTRPVQETKVSDQKPAVRKGRRRKV